MSIVLRPVGDGHEHLQELVFPLNSTTADANNSISTSSLVTKVIGRADIVPILPNSDVKSNLVFVSRNHIKIELIHATDYTNNGDSPSNSNSNCRYKLVLTIMAKQDKLVHLNGVSCRKDSSHELRGGDEVCLLGTLKFFIYRVVDETSAISKNESDSLDSRVAEDACLDLNSAASSGNDSQNSDLPRKRRKLEQVAEGENTLSNSFIENTVQLNSHGFSGLSANNGEATTLAKSDQSSAVAAALAEEKARLIEDQLRQYECIICYETIACSLSLHPCGDSFCYCCITDWAVKSNCCPLCNTTVDYKNSLPNKIVDSAIRSLLKGNSSKYQHESYDSWEERVTVGLNKKKQDDQTKSKTSNIENLSEASNYDRRNPHGSLDNLIEAMNNPFYQDLSSAPQPYPLFAPYDPNARTLQVSRRGASSNSDGIHSFFYVRRRNGETVPSQQPASANAANELVDLTNDSQARANRFTTSSGANPGDVIEILESDRSTVGPQDNAFNNISSNSFSSRGPGIRLGLASTNNWRNAISSTGERSEITPAVRVPQLYPMQLPSTSNTSSMLNKTPWIVPNFTANVSSSSGFNSDRSSIPSETIKFNNSRDERALGERNNSDVSAVNFDSTVSCQSLDQGVNSSIPTASSSGGFNKSIINQPRIGMNNPRVGLRSALGMSISPTFNQPSQQLAMQPISNTGSSVMDSNIGISAANSASFNQNVNLLLSVTFPQSQIPYATLQRCNHCLRKLDSSPVVIGIHEANSLAEREELIGKAPADWKTFCDRWLHPQCVRQVNQLRAVNNKGGIRLQDILFKELLSTDHQSIVSSAFQPIGEYSPENRKL